MEWEKKGLLIKPGRFAWMRTHAQNPFAEHRKGSVYRIYFAGRDKFNRSRGGSADVDMARKGKIIRMPSKPILDLGPLGAFDDSGAMPSCLVKSGNKQYLYYTGWTQARTVPFFFFIGLAVSRDNGRTFRRYSNAPVLGRNAVDPLLTCSPWVIKEGTLWRMWYVSGTKWGGQMVVKGKTKRKHYYHIRYAESRDGIHWNPTGKVCIDFKGNEYAIARPTVTKEKGVYKMWYCCRGGRSTYRAGYAESKDGIRWARKDHQAGITVSSQGWDAGMICYPFVFTYQGKKYMLYNGGKNYGETGCGLAVLKKER